MSTIYLAYHFSVAPNELGSEILIAEHSGMKLVKVYQAKIKQQKYGKN